MKLESIPLISTMMAEVQRLQLADGSFALNEDLAKLLLIDMKHFDELITYLNRQGLSSIGK